MDSDLASLILKSFISNSYTISVTLRDALKRFMGMYKGLFSAGLWTVPSSWVWGGATQPHFVSLAMTGHGGCRRAAWSCIFISWCPNPALLHRSTTECLKFLILTVRGCCDLLAEETVKMPLCATSVERDSTKKTLQGSLCCDSFVAPRPKIS